MLPRAAGYRRRKHAPRHVLGACAAYWSNKKRLRRLQPACNPYFRPQRAPFRALPRSSFCRTRKVDGGGYVKTAAATCLCAHTKGVRCVLEQLLLAGGRPKLYPPSGQGLGKSCTPPRGVHLSGRTCTGQKKTELGGANSKGFGSGKILFYRNCETAASS